MSAKILVCPVCQRDMAFHSNYQIQGCLEMISQWKQAHDEDRENYIREARIITILKIANDIGLTRT